MKGFKDNEILFDLDNEKTCDTIPWKRIQMEKYIRKYMLCTLRQTPYRTSRRDNR